MVLAYEQGLLAGKDLTPIQHWALAYKIVQDKKLSIDTQKAESERFGKLSQDFLFIMNPELFEAINKKNDDPFESDVMMTENDLSSIDDFLNKLNKGEKITASQLSLTDWR